MNCNLKKIFNGCSLSVIVIVLMALCTNVVFAGSNEDQLIYYSFRGDLQTVKNLVAKGANINAMNDNKLKIKGLDSVKVMGTPLIAASIDGHLDVVEFLLSKKAKIDVLAKEGLTALMVAAQQGHKKIVHLLLAKGANPNIKNKYDTTALMLASKYGETEIVQALLAKKADVNAKTEEGWTSLMAASEKGHIAVVRALLENGADINIQNKDGKTALTLATEKQQQQIVKELNKVSRSSSSTTTTTQKKLPPCDVFLKDWGGRGGAKVEDSKAFAMVAPKGCVMEFRDGLFVPCCEESGKMVPQCEGGIRP
jgi:ankyrin repeat protein